MGYLIGANKLKTITCGHCGIPLIVSSFGKGSDWKLCDTCKSKDMTPARDLTHMGVINIVGSVMTKSLCNKQGLGSHIWFKEVHAGNRKNRESPDLIGFRNDNHTTMIEVKVSRSDFLGDKNKKFRSEPALGMGSHRYYACPEGLISVDEIPNKWGLIWVRETPRGYKVSFIKWADEITERNHAAEQNLLFSLLRRINDFVPVQDLVEYEKIVNRQNSIVMSRQPSGMLEYIKEKRGEMWKKIERKITWIRR